MFYIKNNNGIIYAQVLRCEFSSYINFLLFKKIADSLYDSVVWLYNFVPSRERHVIHKDYVKRLYYCSTHQNFPLYLYSAYLYKYYVNIHTDSRKMRILIIRITITVGMSLYQHISVVTYQCETSIHLFCYYYHHQNMTIYMKPFYFYNWSMIRTFIIKGVWVPSTEEPRFAYVLMYVQIWQKGNYKAKFMCMMKW